WCWAHRMPRALRPTWAPNFSRPLPPWPPQRYRVCLPPMPRNRPDLSAINTGTLPAPMQAWLEHLGANRRYSAHTLAAYQHDMALLQQCCPQRQPADVTEHDIRQAIRTLHSRGRTPRSLARTLAAWRGFFQWLSTQTRLDHNPAAMVRAPRATQTLPKAMSVEQTQALLDRPTLPVPETATQWRDQAMFELLYSSGLRLAELVALDIRYTREASYESGSWLHFAAQ